MKDNTLLKQMLCLTQEELENMSITRQGSLRVKVAEGVDLPEYEIKGADVKVGDGCVVVTKKATPRPYSGNTSRIILQTSSEFGNSTTRVTKDGNVLINFTGTTRRVKNYEDVAAAMYCSAESILKKMREDKMPDVDMKDISDEIFLQYNRAKLLYDREEKMKVKSWMTRENNDLMKMQNAK